jgi:AbrB family looped-hinge helix DNA binding protein
MQNTAHLTGLLENEGGLILNGFIAKMTSKGQVTFPKSAREHLGVGEGSSLLFVLQPDGSVSVHNRDIQAIFQSAVNHPIVSQFIAEYEEGGLRASLFIGALIQSGVLNLAFLDELGDTDELKAMVSAYR